MYWYRRKFYMRITGVVISLFLIGATAWGFHSAPDASAESHSAAKSDLSNDSHRSTTSTSAPNPDAEAELQRTVVALKKFVEQRHQLQFKSDVPVKLLSDSDFETKLKETANEDDAESAQLDGVVHALKILNPDQTLDKVLDDFNISAVVGFYDTITHELYVRGAEITPATKVVLVHELTHALQDQNFNINDIPNESVDSVAAFTALVEGDASYIESQYYDSLSDDEKNEVDDEEQQGAAGSFDKTPPAIIGLESFPYSGGEPFIEALVSNGGQSRVSQAFSNPPTSSAQILDPDLYLSNVGPTSVAAPSAAGNSVIQQGTLGEEFLETFVSASNGVGFADGGNSSGGWIGDSYVVYKQTDRLCVAINISFDSSESRAAYSQDASLWADKHGDASVSGSDSSLTLRACSPTSVA